MGNQLQDVFVTNRVPTYTFVQPADFNRIILNLRTAGRPLVIEGPSGIGKTTAVQKAVDELKLRDKIVELKAGLAKDVELIDLLPELSNVGFVFVDDFHKLSDAVKAKIANYIKVLADEGNPNSKVIIAGISEAGKSLIKFAPDLVNRVDIVRFENNSDEKIDELISKGEAALKIMIHCKDEIIKESNGGFYIAQMLCSEVCQRSSVLEENESGALLDVTTSFEGAKSAIWRRIDDRFREPCKAFCLGSRYSPEGRAPYLHLLYWLTCSPKFQPLISSVHLLEMDDATQPFQ